MDLYEGTNSKDFPAKYQHSLDDINVDLLQISDNITNDTAIGEGVIELCKNADAIFLALHGSIGEDGHIQAVLETNNIKYTGSNFIGSMLAMDKILSKRLFNSYNIKTPNWIEVRNEELDLQKIKYPCVIKPLNCGSSVGITIVKKEAELKQALEKVQIYTQEYFIEEKIEGREFSVGILNNEALPIIEIIPENGFYDYDNKYNGTTQEICPAIIDKELEEKLKEIALQVHKVLRLGSYSRIDFIVDPQKNIYCLEANTLPGMTPLSLLPKEAEAANISFEDLCEIIIKTI